MNCTNPIHLTPKNSSLKRDMIVPCGKCIACRIAKKREWSMRLKHELQYYDKNCFVTLTYTDKNLPENNSLKKEHLQKFVKRLRKNLNKQKIKYFACGEYGNPPQRLQNGKISIGYRPHYHILIYGLGIEKEEKKIIIDSWKYADWKELLESGKKPIGNVTDASIKYVAGYINKKYSGELAHTEYEVTGRENVFRIGSNGLGKRFAEEHAKQIIENGYITVFGVKQSIPRYYCNVLGIDKFYFTKNKIENEKKANYDITGMFISDNELLKSCDSDLIYFKDKEELTKKIQHDKNLNAVVNLYKKNI